MEIVWENLKVDEFSKICRLCLANKELEPLAEEEKSTLIKLTPWIIELETRTFFPNNICPDCAKQLQQANEFFNRCNTLAKRFNKCIEEYKECVRKDSGLPSLEVLLFPTKVKIKEEVEPDHENEAATTVVPFTEVFMPENIKMEFECTEIPEQSTSNFNNTEYIESTPDIPVDATEPKEHQKRKRVILTIKNKIDICNRLENGESRTKIMKEYGIGSSTVYDIRKQKDELHKFYSSSKSIKAIKQRKTLRKPKLEQLDTTLYEWFENKQIEGVPITALMLKVRAKELYEEMELTEECTFSDGWLAGFKSRHGIRRLDTFCEKTSNDAGTFTIY